MELYYDNVLNKTCEKRRKRQCRSVFGYVSLTENKVVLTFVLADAKTDKNEDVIEIVFRNEKRYTAFVIQNAIRHKSALKRHCNRSSFVI